MEEHQIIINSKKLHQWTNKQKTILKHSHLAANKWFRAENDDDSKNKLVTKIILIDERNIGLLPN